jgi:hypothetical protein
MDAGDPGGESAGRPMKSPTVGEFSDFLKEQGNSPKIKPGDSGAPMLSVNEGGDNFFVFFFDCSTGGGLAARRCTGVEINVSYPVKKKPTLSEINELNKSYRMAKAYMNAEGNPGISMSINIGGAFDSANLGDTLEWWTAAMRAFEKDIGWK